MKLTKENKLGEGSYGTVYKIMTKDQKHEFAAKIYNVPSDLMTSMEQLSVE